MFTHGVRTLGLAAGISLFACTAVRAESVYVVKLTSCTDEVSCEVMGREELAKLKQQVQAEGRVFPAALANVEKTWKSDEVTKGTPFPGNRFSARKIQETGPFDTEVAKKKADSIQERALPKLPDKPKKMSAQEKEREDARAAREAERTATVNKIAPLLEAEIQRLLSAPPKTDAPATPKPAVAPAKPATPPAPLAKP